MTIIKTIAKTFPPGKKIFEGPFPLKRASVRHTFTLEKDAMQGHLHQRSACVLPLGISECPSAESSSGDIEFHCLP